MRLNFVFFKYRPPPQFSTARRLQRRPPKITQPRAIEPAELLPRRLDLRIAIHAIANAPARRPLVDRLVGLARAPVVGPDDAEALPKGKTEGHAAAPPGTDALSPTPKMDAKSGPGFAAGEVVWEEDAGPTSLGPKNRANR